MSYSCPVCGNPVPPVLDDKTGRIAFFDHSECLQALQLQVTEMELRRCAICLKGVGDDCDIFWGLTEHGWGPPNLTKDDFRCIFWEPRTPSVPSSNAMTCHVHTECQPSAEVDDDSGSQA